MNWYGHQVRSGHMARSLVQVDKTLYKKVAFIRPLGLEQWPLYQRDTGSEAPENAGKAYLDPTLIKTDNRVLNSIPHSNPSWPPMLLSLYPLSFYLSLTIPALCPSAGLIFSRVLLGPSFPPVQERPESKEEWGLLCQEVVERYEGEGVHHWEITPSAKTRREMAVLTSTFSPSRMCKARWDFSICTIHQIFPNMLASVMRPVSITGFIFSS